MRRSVLRTLGAIVVVQCFALATTARGQEVLPRPDQPFKGKIGRTSKDSTPDFSKAVEAPKGAPNVLCHTSRNLCLKVG